MKANVGGLDRAARIVPGLALIVLAAAGVVGIWGYVGVVLAATGALRCCPGYPLLGVNTCPMRKAS